MSQAIMQKLDKAVVEADSIESGDAAIQSVVERASVIDDTIVPAPVADKVVEAANNLVEVTNDLKKETIIAVDKETSLIPRVTSDVKAAAQRGELEESVATLMVKHATLKSVVSSLSDKMMTLMAGVRSDIESVFIKLGRYGLVDSKNMLENLKRGAFYTKNAYVNLPAFFLSLIAIKGFKTYYSDQPVDETQIDKTLVSQESQGAPYLIQSGDISLLEHDQSKVFFNDVISMFEVALIDEETGGIATVARFLPTNEVLRTVIDSETVTVAWSETVSTDLGIIYNADHVLMVYHGVRKYPTSGLHLATVSKMALYLLGTGFSNVLGSIYAVVSNSLGGFLTSSKLKDFSIPTSDQITALFTKKS